jgi:ATP-dependent helicase/nuclease subunit A
MRADARPASGLPDADARRAALTDFERNLVVTAGAGTGKTSLLVGRLLAALLCQHIEPSRVLAVTFTENAAAEMRERLVRMLHALPRWLAGEAIDKSDQFVLEALQLGREHLRPAAALLADADRIPLATFHGFCLRLLQEHAALLDLPAALQVGTDESVRARFDREFLEFLAVAADGEHSAALEHFEARELRELAFALLGLPEEAWDELATPFAPTDLAAREAHLQTLLATYPRARAEWRGFAERLLALFAAVRANRPTGPVDWLERSSVPKAGKRELGEADDATATDALNSHRSYLKGLLAADEAAVALARDFLLPFVRAQRQSRATAGELSFDDLLLLTRRVLLDRPQVRRTLAQRFQAILVDEFQDTDPLQYDVLFLLGSDPDRDPGTPLHDPTALALRPCLFIVGDAKQSIYRFRRADVGAYFRAVEHIAGAQAEPAGRRLALTANFRSRPAVLRFVNSTCRRTLTEEVPYQLGYEAVEPVRGDDPSAKVELLLLPAAPGMGRAYQRRQREGEAVVSLLDELRRGGEPLGNVAILLRAAADTTWLLRPLRQADIPYVLQGSRRFYSRHEIVLAGALLGCVARPFDPVPALAVLRSALCGCTDADLLRWRRQGHGFDCRFAIEGEGPVAEGLRFLRDLRERAAGRPLHEALPALLRHEELLLDEGAGFEGAQRLANLERLLLNLLRSAPLDLGEAAALVERRCLTETDDEESPLFDDAQDAARIMTAHAAKGLEFPVVIVPDLARRPPSDVDGDRPPAQRSFTADGRTLVAVSVGDRHNRAFHVAQQEARQHQEAEERRLFYVAATRAKERLYLLGHDDRDVVEASLWQRDLMDTPLADEGGVHVRDFDPPPLPRAHRDDDASFDAGPTLRALDAQRALAVKAAQRARSGSVAPSSLEATSLLDATSLGERRETALARGRAVHAYLALVDLARRDVDAELLARLASPAVVATVTPWLARFHDGAAAECLRRARQVAREIPVTYRGADQQVVHGIIDALCEDEAGAWRVFDWKTDRDPDPERHAAQLAAYAAGVQKALGLAKPPRAEAVFLATEG